MQESQSDEGNTTDASLYRSGLAVALLAAAPMRIANFAAIEIGRQLRREGDHWTVYLTAEETKTRRADVWPVSNRLRLYLEQYLSVVRPALLRRSRNSTNTARLWIGDSGHPISDQVLRRIIATLTRERLGVTINPHSFRHCAATTFVLERPRDALQTAALLGHASPRTTEQHYIFQQRQLVQQDYMQLLQKRVRAAGRSDE
jgi:integrase/recombinase XerD